MEKEEKQYDTNSILKRISKKLGWIIALLIILILAVGETTSILKDILFK